MPDFAGPSGAGKAASTLLVLFIQCYTSEHMLENQMPPLWDFLHRMGRESRQGAIGRSSMAITWNRPTDATWVRHPKVPMSDATRQRLARLAEQISTDGRKVSPMQIAAQILEDALSGIPEP